MPFDCSRRLTLEERQFIVDKYYECNKKIPEVMKAWNAKYDTKCPARGSIVKLIHKFEETGSVETKQPEYPYRWVRVLFEPRLPAQGSKVLQMKIILDESSPEIWRRIQVQADLNFWEFAWTVISAMGWSGIHKWHFNTPNFRMWKADPFVPTTKAEMKKNKMRDPKEVKLSEVFDTKGNVNCIYFEYDIGDSWLHLIILEKCIQPVKGKKYPVCTAGKNACPPEGCGGIEAYKEMMKAVKDPKHPDHEDMKNWLKEEADDPNFDPKRFSLADVSFEVHQ